MDVREKLAELLEEIRMQALEVAGSMNKGFGAWYADRLIAHGVAFKDVPDTNVGEWISVKDRLPDSSGNYLTYRDGYCYVLSYSTKHKLFNTFDEVDSEGAKRYHIAVTHWMPLPSAPKGE